MQLLTECHGLMSVHGPTFEAEQLQAKINEAKAQLEQPYPALMVLRRLIQLSREGHSMDRHTDPDVIALWLAADRAIDLPFVPDGPLETALAYEERIIDAGAWVQARGSYRPVPGSVIQVWEPKE